MNASHTLIFSFVLLAVAMVVAAIVIRRPNKDASELQKAIALMQGSIIACGIIFFGMCFILPSAPVLGSFGFPRSVEAIQNPERLLQYLQDYNGALHRTINVLHFFLFIFVFWFSMALYRLCTALKKAMAEKPEPNEKG